MILDGAAIIANASNRNSQPETAAYVADALEQALLLLENMTELRQMRKQGLPYIEEGACPGKTTS